MTDETFDRYRKLIYAMKKKGIVKNASEAMKLLNELRDKKGLTDAGLLDKLGF